MMSSAQFRIAGRTAVETADIPAKNAKTRAATRCDSILLRESIISRSPSPIGTSIPVLGSSACPGPNTGPNLMQRMYVSRAFGKMTRVPDNLIETPHTYAARGP
jgi:hypothetical protein